MEDIRSFGLCQKDADDVIVVVSRLGNTLCKCVQLRRVSLEAVVVVLYWTQ